ncbi:MULTISPECIES: AAA family ATPase [Pseudothermotoga]|uniref:Cobyrinic acid ac-diamide synthase n=1 Tax=Pseudothermotoga lettingae (strain ATCC BAA-301 / DSM 14385 / NBRC 107922 / TMO) TaxID=416591 RepID=A8F4V3_PSELT|nr:MULTISPECIES: AAA family ATPase [Pseudothermotoga]ABV33187.1 Cobyrinic acid ac-diamide synthase [Pseudothermotoga lettingae TMO]KUK19986.1 MAG: Site-determining protein [Pseudothermotoga lettingae]MDI3494453.1 flagellar biosynthesis protein FlhG [Pseudothermotoga sp.]MDK2884192.1 flagellar biosynthesis protein FlhG [Pseudothermotoga sp.]GLI49896.1 site-determining protein [Pseudothermotoga lettingae TMO]
MRNQAEGLLKSQPRIVSVASGKGGVGKTIVAVNLAIVLAQRGMRVLLFDADAGFANAEILMGITPKNTIKDFLQRKISLDKVIFQTPYDVDLISTGMDVEDLIAFNLEDKTELYNDLYRISAEYDYIVFDFPPGFNEELERFYAGSDHLVMVTASEPTSLVNAYTFVKLMTIKGVDPDGFHVVMNMVKDMRDGRKIMDRFISVITRFTGIPITSTHLIRYDMLVKDSVNRQIPFVTNRKTAQPSLAIYGIADMITKRQTVKKLSFFDKIRAFFGVG